MSFGRVFPHIKFKNLYWRLISLVVVLNSLKNELKYIFFGIALFKILLVVLEETVTDMNTRIKA